MRNWVKRNYYQLSNLGRNIKIGKRAEFDIHNKFEGLNAVGNGAILASSVLGLGSYIGDNSTIRKTSIGRFSSIGSNVCTGIGTHPSKQFVATHPAFFSSQKHAGFSFVGETIFAEHIFIGAEKKHVVIIGNDVWIGNNAMIMDGVTIGDGAIIAAGAVVTKDVSPYNIVGGLPAKVIRLRFTPEQVEKLLEIKWWNWNIETIKANSHCFNDVENFILSVNNLINKKQKLR